MDIGFLHYFISFIFFCFGLYTIYALFFVIKAVINYAKDKNRTLERDILMKSLASSMIILIFIHLLQIFVRLLLKSYYPNKVYMPIISSGVIQGDIGNSTLHFESLSFDFFLITITYHINRLKHKVISKKQFLRPIIYIILLSIVLTFITFHFIYR